jgi:GntR family transcriptional regulator / MocR family aminotransferase
MTRGGTRWNGTLRRAGNDVLVSQLVSDLAMDVAACPPRARTTLEARLREAIASGRLRVGTVLPSTRVLARELGLSRGTVVDAYDELAAHGYLRTRPGGETTLAADRPDLDPSSGAGEVEFPPVDLRAGPRT